MGKENDVIQGFDGAELNAKFWEAKNAKCVVLLIHGMVEHINRYDYFAKCCNKKGISVFAFDLRGHGQTVKSPEKVGKYDGDLFGDTVQDVIKIADFLHEKCGLPLIIMGHSYGSFVLQEVIQNYQNYAVAVFSGSANMKGDPSVAMGSVVAKITKLFKGKDAPAKMIFKLSFGAYGKNFENKNWLTRDEEVFKKYMEDPYCGNVCSANFYVSFFKHLSKLYRKNNLKNISTKNPVLITSGKKDPVGGKNHKLVDKLDLLYRSLGMNVTYKLWDDCRHEILNELNKDEVIEFIINFILEKIK